MAAEASNGVSGHGGSGAAAIDIVHPQTHTLEWHVASYTVEGRAAAGGGLFAGLRRERKTLLQGLGKLIMNAECLNRNR